MKTLIQILKSASSGLEQGWLFLPNDKAWTADSPCIIFDIDEMEESEMVNEDLPVFAKENNLRITLDSQTIEGIVHCTTHLDCEVTDQVLVEAFQYYFDHDAYLPSPGYVPPSPEEIENSIDLQFYNKLSAENPDKKCEKEDCERGTVKFSVLCKIHHFEMVQKKPCPFTH